MKKSYKLLFPLSLFVFLSSAMIWTYTKMVSDITIPGTSSEMISLLLTDASRTGFGAAGILLLFGCANLIGSHYQRFIHPSLPAYLITAAGIIAIVALTIIMYFGFNSTWILIVSSLAGVAVIILPTIAFFLRGMSADGSEEWTVARIRRDLKKEQEIIKP